MQAVGKGERVRRNAGKDCDTILVKIFGPNTQNQNKTMAPGGRLEQSGNRKVPLFNTNSEYHIKSSQANVCL